MENIEIAALLRDFADLLEIRGANPFRVRAYRNAVNTVGSLSRPVRVLVDEGEDLQALPGIGKDLSQYLEEIVRHGTFARLEELRREIPPTLIELVRLDGVGPKKARKLWKELGVASVADLEERARAGEVEALEGFGKRSVEKVLVAIEELRSLQGRIRISDAEEMVAGILEHVKTAPGVERVEVAGSLRRRCETIGDVDLLVQADDGAEVVDHFIAFPGAHRVEAAGGTKGSVVLHSGLQVDLRVIPAESWGAALHYFTGSKEHNVKVRQRAQRRGLRVNEWGVFESPEEGEEEWGEKLGGAEEEEIFSALDLPWIPPELREDRGEIEAAAEARLPKLLTLADIRGDLQMHSTWSDGKNTLREMAEACRDRGYQYLAVTDHGPSLAMVQGLTPERARRQWDEIDEVRQAVPDIHLFRSVEVDILRDGTLDLPDDVLQGMDLVLVSVHSFMDLDETEMTERVLRAMEHPAVDILGHPTGRIINRRNSFALDVEAVLEAAVQLDVAVELNASPKRLDLSDVHVRRARELGARVMISTDAHSVDGLGVMRFGVDQARRGWLEPSQVLNTLSLDEFTRWVERRSA